MLLAHRPTKLLIVGKSGCGKSTLMTNYILGSSYEKKFIFDHEGEFSFRFGIKPCYTFEELSDSVENAYTIFDPVKEFEGELPQAFNFWCEWVFSVCQQMEGRKLFACDELQKLIGVNVIEKPLALIMETGRRYGIDTVMVAQQPNNIHNRVRNQQTDIISFKMLDINAIRFLEDCGYNPKEIWDLPRGEALHLDLDSGEFSTIKIF